jgi:hypothetical protein
MVKPEFVTERLEVAEIPGAGQSGFVPLVAVVDDGLNVKSCGVTTAATQS